MVCCVFVCCCLWLLSLFCVFLLCVCVVSSPLRSCLGLLGWNGGGCGASDLLKHSLLQHQNSSTPQGLPDRRQCQGPPRLCAHIIRLHSSRNPRPRAAPGSADHSGASQCSTLPSTAPLSSLFFSANSGDPRGPEEERFSPLLSPSLLICPLFSSPLCSSLFGSPLASPISHSHKSGRVSVSVSKDLISSKMGAW